MSETSNELAIPVESSLAVPLDALARQVENALVKLETADPEEAKMIRDDAEMLQNLMRARNVAQEQIYPVAELKLKAERTIGAKRLSLPRRANAASSLDWDEIKHLYEQGDTVSQISRKLCMHPSGVEHAIKHNFVRSRPSRSDASTAPSPRMVFDRDLGIIRPTALRWQHLAMIPDSQYVAILQDLRREGSDLSTAAVLYRANRSNGTGKTLERNIRVMHDGRLRLTWMHDGVRRSELLATKDVVKAREILLMRKGLAAKTRDATHPDLHKAYSELRISLQNIDRSLPALNSVARRLAETALAHGHKCEDALSKAINVS